MQFTKHQRGTGCDLYLTVGLERSEKGGEQGSADADVHQLGQRVQSQLRGEVVEERVRVLTLVLLHQFYQVLHRGQQTHRLSFILDDGKMLNSHNICGRR